MLNSAILHCRLIYTALKSKEINGQLTLIGRRWLPFVPTYPNWLPYLKTFCTKPSIYRVRGFYLVSEDRQKWVKQWVTLLSFAQVVMRGCSIEYEVKKCRQQFKSDSFLKDCQTFPLERFHLWLSRYYLCPLLRINLALSHLVLVT